MKLLNLAGCLVSCLSVVSLYGETSLGDTSARQNFVVRVPARIQIAAPATQVHAESSTNQSGVAFESQSWELSSNMRSGATVQFMTEHYFQHVDHPEIVRDAQLEIMLWHQSSPGAWTVTTGKSATSYQSGIHTATVQARSSRPGRAKIGLTVTFLPDNVMFTPPGEYQTTIVGTITAE